MAATITVTATVQDPSGTALAGNSFLRFRLRNFAGFVPQISGTSILPEIQIDATPTAGLISQTLWPNNAITPSTTFYTVELWNQGRITSSGNYIFNTSTNLNSAVQVNAPPVPSGFSLVLENNNALNSSQSTLNLSNADGTIVITDLGAGKLDLKSGIATPAVSYMLGPGITNIAAAPTPLILSSISPVARVLSVCKFFLQVAISGFTKLDGSFSCSLGPGSHFAIGFYDDSGSLLWSSGALAVPNVGNTSISFTVPSLSLASGSYYYAWTADDTGNTGTWVTQGVNPLLFNFTTTDGNVVNQGTVRAGTAANAATSGPVLPNTLGAISVPGSTFSIPLVLFR